MGDDNQTRNDASGRMRNLVQAGPINGNVIIHSPPDQGGRPSGADSGVTAVRGAPRRGLGDLLGDWLAGGGQRRVRLAAGRLEKRFSGTGPDGTALDRAARSYRDALRVALRVDPDAAAGFFRSYDRLIPDRCYPFTPYDEAWLGHVSLRDDRHVLTIVFEIATRVRLDALQIQSRDRMAALLADGGDADSLASQLLRWQDLHVLGAEVAAVVLRGYVARARLEHDTQLWRSFFDHLPKQCLPELFDVRCFLGRGAEAVRLADTSAREKQALECCLASSAIADAEAGLELARRAAEFDAVVQQAKHLGDLHFEAMRYIDALPAYQEAKQLGRVSACHEHLGQFLEAIATCQADEPDRLARLAGLCRPGIDLLVERREFADAARQVQELVVHLQRAVPVTPAVVSRREDVDVLRDDLLRSARMHFTRTTRELAEGADRRTAYGAWSRFEESAGEIAEAARRAEVADELYRAVRLFRQAGLLGEAARVLKGDETPEGRHALAEVYEAGGDLLGAASLYQQTDRPGQAVDLFRQAEDFAAATRCLVDWLGDEAIEDPRLADCLRRTREFDELVGRCATAIRLRGRGTRAFNELRRLREEDLVPPHRSSEVDSVLAQAGAVERHRFEERAEAWVGQARAETDVRFARVWGLDLGTTTSAAAVFDTRTGKPVLCPWKGEPQFASTLSLDKQKNELIGLSGEETLGGRLLGHIDDAKRWMGHRKGFKIPGHGYQPEDVAARVIRHARSLVEDFLAAQVRDRVAELARDELGEVWDEWLSWAEQNHDLRLDRGEAVVTVPAYFTNNQHHATRSACEIAGVKAAQLIHEPTAACVAVAHDRRLAGRIAVVDLGGGTLDISLVEVTGIRHKVRVVAGNTEFGGKNLDAAVAKALEGKLEQQGVPLPLGQAERRRLLIAAEHLKVALSAQEHAEYLLPGFAGVDHLRLELSRDELAGILAAPLDTLRDACAEFRASLPYPPDSLILVGRPMLSPLVRDVVEKAFALDRTATADPINSVARGAALIGANRSGALKELRLEDVTALPLGIAVAGERFSEIIAPNTPIPVERTEIYTTTHDMQREVAIEAFNGSLTKEAKIGQFRLTGLPPAAKGVPKIEVTFKIDHNCVLEVTGRDRATGESRSIQAYDTTLLRPEQIKDLTLRYKVQREREERDRSLKNVRERIHTLVDEAMHDDSEAAWREFRHRKAAHRPSQARLDADTQQALVEMFSQADQMEVDLDLARRALGNLVADARNHLDRPAEDEALTEGERLVGRLRGQLNQIRHLMARVAPWNAALIKIAAADPDPLVRFRNGYACGEYRQALEALADLPSPPDDPDDIRRMLRCAAEVGDRDRYGAMLTANAGRLSADPVDPSRPDTFIDRVRPALVRVRTAGGASGTGFLIRDDLVVTNRHWLTPEADGQLPVSELHIDTDAGTRTVERVHLPDSPRSDVAVLRLTQPVPRTPLRLGYPRLMRIGDRVWAPGPDIGTPTTTVSAVVDRFESFPEEDLHVVRAGLPVPPSGSGGPLCNDLGEVVGILAINQDAAATADAAYALTVDSLNPLLAQAGFERHP
ncbi:Hsp70 family protein [Streptomyces sp. NPDC002888]|uniref:Hsp70 family protein n=1 Tax=Streptomyces sp. NPDC002888 TaxID=3364668 RepID=UPI003690209C